MDRTSRIFSKQFNDRILIDDDQVIHMYKSLRLKQGDNIIVFDGKTQKGLFQIDSINKNQVLASQKETLVLNTPRKEIVLLQSLVNFKKFDEIIKKVVPLGVTSIIPVETQYTITKLRDLTDKKFERMEKIIIEECKQSERDVLPYLHRGITISQLDQFAKSEINLIATTKDAIEINTVLKPNSSISIFIGPEGDFTNEEVDVAKSQNFIPVTIHQNILRTELAAVYLSSIASYI